MIIESRMSKFGMFEMDESSVFSRRHFKLHVDDESEVDCVRQAFVTVSVCSLLTVLLFFKDVLRTFVVDMVMRNFTDFRKLFVDCHGRSDEPGVVVFMSIFFLEISTDWWKHCEINRLSKFLLMFSTDNTLRTCLILNSPRVLDQ